MLLHLIPLAFAEPAILIHDVRVFDGESVQEHQDVRVEGDRVVAVGPSGPADAETVVEGAGRTLMPGLIDAHAHATFSGAPPWAKRLPDPTHNLAAHLAAGVTTILDVAGTTEDVAKLARRVAQRTVAGPEMIFAGSAMSAPGGYPGAYLSLVMNPRLAAWFLRGPVKPLVEAADAEANAAAIARAGGRFLKLFVAETPAGIPVLSDALIAAAVEAAHRHGLRPIAHIDTAENALRAARAGVELLVHGVHTDVLTDAQAAELAALGVSVVPTLITFERLHQMHEAEAQFNAVERATEDPALLARFNREEAVAFGLDPRLMTWLEGMGENTPERLVGNTARLRAAGVPLFAGSDANGSIASFPGALHDELGLLVGAGLSPVEALRAATSATADWLGRPELGHIRVGAEADLVLVEGDPTTRISDTQRIVAVYVDGLPLGR